MRPCRKLGGAMVEFTVGEGPGSTGNHSVPGPARQAFERDGYIVVRQLCPPSEVRAMREDVLQALDPLIGPAELEADVGYPGAPAGEDTPGGNTPRRLLGAYARSDHFRAWYTSPVVRAWLGEVMDTHRLCFSQNHHNCVMTKHPGFSSVTLWHQDIRYWSFDRPELVSAWLALGEENTHNGALRVVPGSHRLRLDRGRFDHALFVRPDLEQNRELLRSAIVVDLAPGDVLLFHCRAIHAAGRNLSEDVKLSVVGTYHALDNRPIPGTRSAQLPSIGL